MAYDGFQIFSKLKKYIISSWIPLGVRWGINKWVNEQQMVKTVFILNASFFLPASGQHFWWRHTCSYFTPTNQILSDQVCEKGKHRLMACSPPVFFVGLWFSVSRSGWGGYVECCPTVLHAVCSDAIPKRAHFSSRNTALSRACPSRSPLHFLQMSGDTIMIAFVFTVR